MKIKKNLSDAEMLKGFAEKESFETAVLKDSPVKKIKGNVKEEKLPLLSLPAETIEKLDKAVLQMRIDCKKRGISEVKWQVSSKNEEIILKAVAKKQ